MNNSLLNSTFIGTFFGLIILIFSIIKQKKILEELKRTSDEEFLLQNSKLGTIRYIILGIIGISIIAIMQIIRLFLR